MWCYFIRGIQYYHWVIVRNQRLANINNLGLDSNARSLHKVFELRFYMCVVYISAVTAHNVTPVFIHIAVPEMEHAIGKVVICVFGRSTTIGLNATYEPHGHEIVQAGCKGAAFNLACL